MGSTSHLWLSVASSADGAKLVAVDWEDSSGGRIFTSSDFGITWIPRNTGSNDFWNAVASSADGSKLVVTAERQIYTSTDSGVTWIPRTPRQPDGSPLWSSVASSADGSKLVATMYNGRIYTSSDTGTNWTARESVRGWYSVASSSDGSKLVAAAYNGQLYTSSDSGASWTARETNRPWSCVAASSDGSRLVAGCYGGNLYTSTDSGAAWTARETARDWKAVASSADGLRLVALDRAWASTIGGRIYTSTDGGITWAPRENNRPWQAIASSADGSRLVAVEDAGQIYTSTTELDRLPDRTYGDAPFTVSATASSGLPVSFSVVSGPAITSGTDGTQVSIRGTGAVTLRASQPGNATYLPAPDVDQTFSILPAVLTITADDKTRTYGQPNPPLTASVTGFVYGENSSVIAGSPAFGTAAGPVSSVPGSPYPITVSIGTLSAANYTFRFLNGSLTVNQAALTATADNKSRTSGAANPPLTISYSGFVNGENPSVIDTPPTASTAATSESEAGTYPILLTGGSDDNYSITLANGLLTVLPEVGPGTLPVTAGGIVYSRQTGLYTQGVTVSNPLSTMATAVRVLIDGLPSNVTVYNASGSTNGTPYVQSALSLFPGGSVTFQLEYFVPTRQAFAAPVFEAQIVPGESTADPGGSPQAISRAALRLGDGAYLVEFATVSNRIYYVQYSSDLVNWKTAVPFREGNGTQVQWIDSGPPKTESPPTADRARFYRVLWLPR